MSAAGWLFDVLGVKDVFDALGTLYPRRASWRILGASLADNPTLGTTDISLPGANYFWSAKTAPAAHVDSFPTVPSLVWTFGDYVSEPTGTWVVTRPFIATALTFVCVGNALATDTVLVALRKNGVDTALTFTIPAASARGVVRSDLAHQVAFAAGDLISLRINQSGATAQANWGALFQVG